MEKMKITDIFDRFGKSIWWKATCLNAGDSIEVDAGSENNIRITRLPADEIGYSCFYSVEYIQVHKLANRQHEYQMLCN